jgi:hypothetical protein
MWGLYLDLKMVWREWFPHLIVESGTKILINMVTNNCKISRHVPTLVRLITIFWLWIGVSKFVILGEKVIVVLIDELIIVSL